MDRVTLDVESRQTDTGVTVLAPSGRLDVAGAPALKDEAAVRLSGLLDLKGVR